MRCIELFGGAGGLALGLSRAGFRHEMIVDKDAWASKTVLYNHSRGIRFIGFWNIKQADVRDIDWQPFTGIDLVAGGPPCQPFSIGGKHRGNKDERDMWPEAIRAVREMMPKAFLFENVQGLVRPAFAEYLRWIVAYLRYPAMARRESEDYVGHALRLEASPQSADYKVIVAKVNAADYGTAQKRNRVFIAGVRADLAGALELPVPVPTHSRERLLWDKWGSGVYWQRHGLAQPDDSLIPSSDRIGDGNGRVGRILSTWEMYRRQFDTHHIFSVDEVFWENRKRYYTALEYVHQQKGDLTGWLEFVSESVELALERAWMRIEAVRSQKGGMPISLSPNQEKILRLLRESPAGISEIQAEINVTKPGAHFLLKPLIEKGLIKRVGGHKTGKYTLV